MTYQNEYKKWLGSDAVSPKVKEELAGISANEGEIKERFSAPLSFGTAGLRGILRAGTNGMNLYTVRQATQGLASVILAADGAGRGVVIAHDPRIFSPEFAREAAAVLAANGIFVYLFDELRPTPELSFAIRELGAISGINVTASHNPKEYNGYKVYWEDGAQISPERAEHISQEIAKTDIFSGVRTMDFDEALRAGKIKMLGREIDEKYLARVLAEAVNPEAVSRAGDRLGIVFTPFHGAGYRLVPEVLKRLGIQNVWTVPEQMIPDGNFPTVKSPNPEDKAGFTLAISLAKERGVDLVIGTDPDADRMGILVRNDAGEYISLSGNQIGCVLTDYILRSFKERGALPENGAVIKSIVSTTMVNQICESYGIQLFEVLTGFKFIGEKMTEFEKTNSHVFLFGFEESYGYLKGSYARDKDAIVASMLIAEAACYHSARGMTLFDAMESLYREFGYFLEDVVPVEMKGLGGKEKMDKMMGALRSSPPEKIAGIGVRAVRDYLSRRRLDLISREESEILLPESDVLYFELEDGSSFIVRPSGTEPKIKIYLMTSEASREKARAKLDLLSAYAKSLEEQYR